MKLNPYINFDGDCEAAFKYYAQNLGAKVTAMMTWKEAPMADELPAEMHDKVMHAELDIDGHVLMGTDGSPAAGAYDGVKAAHVVLHVDTPEEAERIFALLSEGGNQEMAMEEAFFARRFGMAVDRFGLPWMVICG